MTSMLFLIGIAALISTLIGGIVMLKSNHGQHYLFAISAGSLLGIAFLDLMPEGLTIGNDLHMSFHSLLCVMLLSFFIYSFVDKYFLTHHLHSDDLHEHPMGIFGASSLVLHSIFDGIAIGVAFQASSRIGLIVATAIVCHDFLDGTNTVVVMLKNNHSKLKAFLFLIADALAPIIGIALTTLILVPEKVLAYILMFFAGEFVYLSMGAFWPEIKKEKSIEIIFSMVGGAAIIAIVTSIF